MASLATNTSTGEALSAENSSRNKRKYRADTPVIEENKYVSLSDNDLPLYEFPNLKLESIPTPKDNIGCDMCENSDPLKLGLGLLTEVGSSDTSSTLVGDENEIVSEWTNLKEDELMELLLHELDTIFKSAIKKVAGFGYSEDVAYKAVLMSGAHYGPKDIISNIVENALYFIRTEDVNDVSKHFSFESLENMEKYVLAEMVCSIREVRPSLSSGEALWRLLLWDMNVTKACSWDGTSKVPPQSETKNEANLSQFSFSATGKPNPSSEICECKVIDSLKPMKKAPNPASFSGNELKWKKNLGTKREYILRQKALHLERSYRSYSSKGSSKWGKNVNNFGGGLVLDKNLKSLSESAGVNFKNANAKVTKTEAETEVKTETDLRLMRLMKTEKILKEQLVQWKDWAHEKVMEATKRLGKDKAELKALRLERDEGERLKREKQALEENTMKKLLEMENALRKAGGQMERANLAVRRLEGENVWLRREMESAKDRAKEAATGCREGEKREKEAASKVRGWEREKGALRDELAAEKKKLAEVDREVGVAKVKRDQQEARYKQEEKAKDELLQESNFIREEREELEASTKLQEETIKANTEENLEKYKNDIQKLEKEISQWSLKNNSSKIAAMRRGVEPVGPKEGHKGNLEKSAGVKRERECVMCLSEEMSVVFMPCAHQVVCAACNESHEKEGMKECPSCRTAIQQRISVRFARK